MLRRIEGENTGKRIVCCKRLLAWVSAGMEVPGWRLEQGEANASQVDSKEE